MARDETDGFSGKMPGGMSGNGRRTIHHLACFSDNFCPGGDSHGNGFGHSGGGSQVDGGSDVPKLWAHVAATYLSGSYDSCGQAFFSCAPPFQVEIIHFPIVTCAQSISSSTSTVDNGLTPEGAGRGPSGMYSGRRRLALPTGNEVTLLPSW
jgi:hypothetical protein